MIDKQTLHGKTALVTGGSRGLGAAIAIALARAGADIAINFRSRDPEDEIPPLLRELGIGFVPYSPFGMA